jgi:phage terminase large subunit
MTPAQARLKSWKENPAQFVNEVFGVSPDAWQVETLSKLGGGETPRRRVGMKACTGPGKSAVLAWIGWHRLSCFARKGEHPKGAALSGEGRDNLRDNLWAELSKWQQRSEFLKSAFTWNKEQIFAKDHSETWFLSARSYAKDADAESIGRSLSGLHSNFPFILLDETGDMPVTVGQKAEQIFTGGVVDGLVAAAGNPTSTTGLLYHICTNARGQWEVITITADPDDPKRTPRVDTEHAREQIILYGRDNPWVMATILGQFPSVGFNTLLSLAQVELAMKRHLRIDQYDFSQKRLGVDVARFGDDMTVIFPRQGLAAFKPVVMRNSSSTDVAARVAQAKLNWGSELETVDGTGGYGSGVVDTLRVAGHAPVEVHFSGSAINPRYFNKRSEMWFELADWVKRGGALPSDRELVKELTAPTYTFQNGKLRLEEKEQIKKRLGFSPDRADALALTFAMPDMPGSNTIEGYKNAFTKSRVKSDWDPFDESRERQ